MGFNQRQAGGKFTRDEADAFIEQLQSEAEAESESAASAPPTAAAPVRKPAAANRPTSQPRGSSQAGRLSKTEIALRDASDELLASELQRRGWIVVEP